MNSLIIGSSSQLSYYFPKEYERVSGRNLDLSLYEDKFYDRVFITFAEQRLNEITDTAVYIQTNTIYTIQLVLFFKSRANYIIVYGSCELWNNYVGGINLADPFDYDKNNLYTGYCISKKLMNNSVHDYGIKNVIVLHPFNFNSPYRKTDYLFYKIFDSIINKKKIEIGDTYFYRDIVHPKYVVERSMLAIEDEIVGSGRLTFVNDFIRALYREYGMNYESYVTETFTANKNKRNIFYLKAKHIQYTDLIIDTLKDIDKCKNT